jgi:hypothetical protein
MTSGTAGLILKVLDCLDTKCHLSKRWLKPRTRDPAPLRPYAPISGSKTRAKDMVSFDWIWNLLQRALRPYDMAPL